MIYIKRNDSDFVIDIDVNVKDSGYNVVSKEIDPYNKYSIEEIQAYANEHPEDEVVWSTELNMYVNVEV